jgi:hypothetical protein
MKGLKIIMIVIMLLGILVSICNFTAEKVKAGPIKGEEAFWPDGTYKGCEDIGNECVISPPGVPIE